MYKHLTIMGIIIFLVSAWFGYYTVTNAIPRWQNSQEFCPNQLYADGKYYCPQNETAKAFGCNSQGCYYLEGGDS